MTIPVDIAPGDINWIHALNKAHEVELSPLTRDGVVSMVARATYARAIDGGAFLLGFDQDGDYDSQTSCGTGIGSTGFSMSTGLLSQQAIAGRVWPQHYTKIFSPLHEIGEMNEWCVR